MQSFNFKLDMMFNFALEGNYQHIKKDDLAFIFNQKDSINQPDL